MVPFGYILKETSYSHEKKDPTPFPSEFDNNYFSNFDNWFNDNVSFRDAFISLYGTIDEALEKAWFNFLLALSGESGFDYPSSGSIEGITDPYLDKGQPYFAPRYNGYVLYGRDNWLFYTGDGALSDYKGENILNDYQMYQNMKKFESIQSICNEKGINVSFTIFPNKEQVYADKMPSIRVTNRAKKLQRIEHYFKNNSDLNFSYPLDKLIESRSDKELYLMEDTHWNPLGAMLGYEEILKAQGKASPTYTYSETTYQGGDLAGMISSDGNIYTSYDVTYKNDVTYEVVNDGDRRYKETKSSLTDGSRCVLVGDSFRDALLPYAAKDYENLTCIHYDYMNSDYTKDEIAKLKPGDTLVILSVERLYSSLVNSLDTLANHLNNI